MDWSWMKASHVSDEYHHEVEQFLQFTEQNAQSLEGGGDFFVHVFNVWTGDATQ